MPNTREARIETCTYCNYSCIFCPHDSLDFKRKKEIMSLDLYKYILKKLMIEAPYINEITISGFGESFLDKSLIQKIEYSRKLGYRIHIVTNGSFLSDGIIDELIKLNIIDIRISLHSIISDNYEKITNANKGLHKKIMQSIEYIIKNKAKTKIILTVEQIDINKEEIPNIIKFYEDRVDLLEIWTPHNWVNTFSYRFGPIVRSTCGRPINGPLQIQVDGTINMCCFDYNGILYLGDFKTQTLSDIFSSNLYLDLKNSHMTNLEDTKYICKDCDQRKNQETVVVYNSLYDAKDRIFRTSTNYVLIGNQF
jgi:pyruvate-formate lyase-activating enzyme